MVSRLVGATVSAAPAPAPAWERTSACTYSGILVNKSSRYRSSTLALASCCQPDRTRSKWSGSRSGGRVPAAAASQLGGSKSHDPSQLTTSNLCGLKETCLRLVLQLSDQLPCNPGGDAQQTPAMCLPNSPRTLGCSHDKQIVTRCLPEQKAWTQLRPRRPLALEICGEFCSLQPLVTWWTLPCGNPGLGLPFVHRDA